MGSTVAMKGHGDRGGAGFCCGCQGVAGSIAGLEFGYGLRIYAAGIFAVSVSAQGNHKAKRNEASQQTGFVGAFSGLAQAIRFFGRAGGTHNVLCLLLPVLTDADFEEKTLAEPGPLTAPGKGGDVDEYLRPARSGRDESKSAIIVPFCKRAVYAHKYSSQAQS